MRISDKGGGALELVLGLGDTEGNGEIVPQVRADEVYSADNETNKKLRGQGITARLVVPSVGIIRGTGAVVTTGDEHGRRAILKEQAALHLKLTIPRQRGMDRHRCTRPDGGGARTRSQARNTPSHTAG